MYLRTWHQVYSRPLPFHAVVQPSRSLASLLRRSLVQGLTCPKFVRPITIKSAFEHLVTLIVKLIHPLGGP